MGAPGGQPAAHGEELRAEPRPVGRRSRWRTQACAGWLDWPQRRQIWPVRTEKFARQTMLRAADVPTAVEAHDYLANPQWNRLDGAGILGVVRSHWGIENNGVQTLDMDWEEERAWCTIRAATDVLGLLRWWAYNWVGLLKGRDLRAPRYRVLTRFCGVGRAGQCMGRGRAAHSPGGAGRLRWEPAGGGHGRRNHNRTR
jgi:hypothetical protein